MRWVVSLLALVSLCGCFSYAAQIRLEPRPETPTDAVACTETAKLDEAVRSVVIPRGFAPFRDLEETRRKSREDPDDEHETIGEYYAKSSSWTDDRVWLFVRLEKSTSLCSVLIRNLDWPGSSEATDSLEHELTDALAAAFPALDVRVERETWGPALAP